MSLSSPPAGSDSSARGKYWTLISRIPIWLVLTLLFGVYLVHSALYLSFPFQVEFGEGSALAYAERVRQGLTLYPDPNEPPFVSCPYMPLYFWLVGKLMAWWGLGFWPGRLVSIASTFLTAALLAYWGWRRSGPPAALYCSGFYCASALVLYWSKLVRVDPLGLLFVLAGLLCCCSDGKRKLHLGAICFVLAFAVKQTFVAAPLAVGLVLLKRRPKEALTFGVLYASLVLLVMFTANAVTDGSFWLNTVELTGKSTYNVYDMQKLWDHGGPYLLSIFPQLLLALWYVFRFAWKSDSILVVFWLLSLGIAFGVVRAGGFYNYFLEFHLALCLLAGFGAAKLAEQRPILTNALVLFALVLGCHRALPPFFYSPYEYGRYETAVVLAGELPGYLRKSWEAEELRPWVEHFGGPILCENQGNVVLLGHTPWLCDISYFLVVIKSGAWDQEKLLKLIREGHFSLIVLQKTNTSRLTKEIKKAISDYYEEVGRAGPEHVFRAKARLKQNL